MTPKQSTDNPHNIIENRVEWARFEYDRGRGSLMGLADYAKRFALMQAILLDRSASNSVLNAMTYLLGMGSEREI